MRAGVLAFAVVSLAVAGGPGRSDDKPVRIDLAKKKSFQEGALKYTVKTIENIPGRGGWTIYFEVENTSEKVNVTRAEWVGRFEGWKMTDDTGREYVGVSEAISAGSGLVPGAKGDFDLSFEGKPNPKAKVLTFKFRTTATSPAVEVAIPAAMLKERR